MSDLIGICGQVRGLAPKLLNKGQIDRMVGAANADEAFRVLTELQYADYIDQDTELSDFGAIITQGLYETRELLASGAGDHPGLDFLWLEFDLNNVKRALKAKLIEGSKELTDFSDAAGYSNLGNVSAQEINRLVFEHKPGSALPETIESVVLQAEYIENSEDGFRGVEFALDQAFYLHLGAVVEKANDPFLSEYFFHLVEVTQTRNVARSLLTLGGPLPVPAFLPFGYLDVDRAGKITSFEEFAKLMVKSPVAEVMADISDADSDAEKMLKLEQALDKASQQFLAVHSMGSLDSAAVLIDYFRQRLHNARVLKLIMYGKLNGVSSDKIYQLIDNV